jgi:hypothetical protein
MFVRGRGGVKACAAPAGAAADSFGVAVEDLVEGAGFRQLGDRLEGIDIDAVLG